MHRKFSGSIPNQEHVSGLQFGAANQCVSLTSLLPPPPRPPTLSENQRKKSWDEDKQNKMMSCSQLIHGPNIERSERVSGKELPSPSGLMSQWAGTWICTCLSWDWE